MNLHLNTRIRKPLFLAVAFILLLQPSTLAVGTVRVGVKSHAFVSAVQGTAQRASGTAWGHLRLNQLVKSGDRVKTATGSRLELTFSDGSRLRLGPQTDARLTIDRPAKEPPFTFVNLLSGKLWARVKRGSRFATQTKLAVAAVLGTTYRMEQVQTGETQAVVYEGTVGVQKPFESTSPTEINFGLKTLPLAPLHEISGPQEVAPPVHEVEGPKEVSLEEWLQITANQQITVGENGQGKLSKIDPALDSQDPWVQWNQERDKLEN